MELNNTTPIAQRPRRLSERRGQPGLQPLDPILPSKVATTCTSPEAPRDVDIESSDSSIPSGVFSPENYATPTFSAPATPTDPSPLRALGMPFGVSSIVGTSIQEEEEESNWDCQECEARCEEYGLGLAVGAVGTMGKKDVAFPRLDIVQSVRSVHEAFEDSCCGSHYHYNEKLAPVAMPPTPPENEQPFMFSTQTSPTSPAIDAEAFSSGPASLAQSPKGESSARHRAAIILNKVVPARLRASLKRRMSGATDATQPPALPPINTTSTYTASASPDTPPDDTLASWPRRIVAPPHRSDDNISPLASPESILPPMLLPSLSPRSPAVETESFFASPHQSPRAPGVPSFARMGSLPETPTEVVNSPLYPPTISPLTSPSLASSPSQASLRSAHKKVPSIDPATPLAPRMPAAPLTTVTANSLADMIEEMRGELEAYDATLARMIGGGWSSPQEIRNVELQREETQRSWQQRISESKEILEGIRRREVKRSAMSSVSSFDSCGSSSAAGSSVQPTLSHVTSATSLSGSERSVPT